MSLSSARLPRKMLRSCDHTTTKEPVCRPLSPLSSAIAEDPQILMTTAEKKGQGKLLFHKCFITLGTVSQLDTFDRAWERSDNSPMK